MSVRLSEPSSDVTVTMPLNDGSTSNKKTKAMFTPDTIFWNEVVVPGTRSMPRVEKNVQIDRASGSYISTLGDATTNGTCKVARRKNPMF